MRTISHRIMAATGTAATMLTLTSFTEISLLGVIAGISGGMSAGTAPDKLEYLAMGVRWIKHRTLTHWPTLWLGVIASAMYLVSFIGDFAYAVVGYGLGALFHILGDWCTPKGIPLWLPNRKSMRSGNIVRSTKNEFWVVLTFCVITGIICKLQIGPFLESLPAYSSLYPLQ